MSFDSIKSMLTSTTNGSQSLSSRAMSFDEDAIKGVVSLGSQSLSSRAMSFDEIHEFSLDREVVSIPFEQGDVFRLSLL